jgi:hypothetical protein
MKSEEEQTAFDLGVGRGVEIYKKTILEMLYSQLDLEGDPNSECAACQITKQYIDAIEGNSNNKE